MSLFAGWFNRKVRDPLLAELKQGITAKDLALACAVSLAIAVNPFIGTTTLLCLLAGRIFRLNHVVMQIINYFSYPLQIALIIPWVRLGEKITGSKPQVIEIGQMKAEFTQSFAGFLSKFCEMGLHAFLGWLVVIPVVTWILYRIFIIIFRRFTAH